MSVRRVQLRRGTHAENDAFAGAIGEVTVDTTNDSLRVHDGTTNGGFETLKANLSNLPSNVLTSDVSFLDSSGSVSIKLINVADPTAGHHVATKSYVDSGGASSIEISELADVTLAGGGETTLGDAQLLIYDNNDEVWRNKALSTDLTITHEGIVTIANDAITTVKLLDLNVTNGKLANSSLTVGSTSISLGASSTTLAGMTGIDFTSASASIASSIGTNTLTLGGGTSTVAIANDLTIAGDLTVNGDTTTVSTTNLDVEDTVIRLNKGVAGGANTNDIGIFFERGTTGDDAILYWDEGEDIFKLGTTSNDDHTATDFGGNLTFGELKLLTLTATGAGTFGTTLGVTGLLNADGGLELDNGGVKFAVSTAGSITATSASSSFKSGTSIGDITFTDGNLATSTGTFTLNDNHLTTTGNISTTGSGALTVAGVSTLTGSVSLNGGGTVDSGLNFKKASTETDKLIVLNSDVGVSDGQNAVIGVDIGAGNYSTITWQQDETTWAFTHSGSFDSDFTVGQDLVITRHAEVGNDLTIKDTLFIESQPTSDFGIVFNSDRGANDINSTDYDVKLITVEAGSGNATEGIISWDDDQSTFAIDGGKLHSNTDFSVGTSVGTNTFSVAKATGNTSISGTLAVTSTLNAGATTLTGALDLSDNSISNVDTLSLDTIQSADDVSTFQIKLDDNQPTALDINEAGTSYQKFVTTNSGEKVVFGKLIEAPASSKIADFTITNGSLVSDTGTVTLGSGNLTTSGDLTTTGTGTLTVAGTSTLGTVEVSGVLSADGGINVDDVFVVADSTGAISTTGDLTINTNKFTVAGSTGNTVIAGTLDAGETTLSGDLDLETTATNGITFRSEIGNLGASADQTLIRVNDGGSGPAYKTLKWDTSPSVFDFSHAVNATGDLSVGAVGSSVLTVASASGNTTLSGLLNIKSSDISNASQNAIVVLNSDVGTSQERDAIVEVERGNETNSYIKWNETDDQWEISSKLKSMGDVAIGSNKLTVASSSGNTTIAGTLDVTGDSAVGGDLTITGDLTVNGATTTLSTATLDVEDTVIRLNKGVASGANTNDIGLFFERGTTGDDAIFFWDEGDTFFKLGTTTNDDHTATDFGGSLSLTGLQLGSIELIDNTATSFDIKQGANSYLKFVTTDSGEKVVFGKIFEGVTSSKIGNLTLGNGSITDSSGAISLGSDTLTTTGSVDFGSTTVDALNASNGGITLAGAISGATTLATITGITLGANALITMPNDSATGLRIMGDVGAGDVGDHAYMTFVTSNEAEAVVVNQEGEDIDFRVEGDGNANLIFARASDDKVGIKTANPQFDLDVTGSLGVSGLADLNGGVDVNGSVFTVSTAGAMIAKSVSQIQSTLNVTTGSTTAFVVEQAGGTDVLNVDTTNNITTFTGTVKADTVQSATGGTGNFTLKIADNVENALTIEDATNGLDFIKIDSSNDAELITLAQATSLSETLSVTGVATFINTVKLEDSSGGIIFNSDDTNASDNASATMLTVERGTDTNAIVAWDESVAEFNINNVSGLHLVGKTNANALTIGGATSASAVASINTSGALSVASGTATIGSGGALVVTSANIGSGGITNAGAISGATSISLDKITDRSSDGIEIELADNGTNALLIRQGTGGESYLTVNSSTEIITLHQDTSVSETLNVTGITTLDDTLKLKYTDGLTTPLILANSDRTGSGEEADAVLVEVERGILANAEIKWDETSDCFEFNSLLSAESNFQVGSDASSPKVTINSTSGNIATTGSIQTDSVVNFTTASQSAITFNSDLDSGVAPNINDDFGLTVNRGSATDASLHWDEGDDVWQFNTGNVQTQNALVVDNDSAGYLTLSSGSILSESGEISFGNENLTTTGTLDAGATTLASLNVTGSLTVDGSGNIGSVTDIELDSISANTNDISLNLTDNRPSALDITQGANSYLKFVTTDSGEKVVFGKVFEGITASKIGDIQISNGQIETTNANNNLSFNDNNLLTTGTLGAGVATLATGSTVGNLTLADGSITDSGGAISFNDENLSTTGTLSAGVTTITSLNVTGDGLTAIKLNSDLGSSAPSANVGITVDRGSSTDSTLFYDETANTWKANRGEGIGNETLLSENDTLFTIETDTGTNFTFEQTDGSTLKFTDLGNNQIDIQNTNGTISVGLKDSVTIQENLTVSGNLTITGNVLGDGNRVSFNDGIIQLADANTSADNDLGFYAQYKNSSDATRYAGLLYQPDSTSDLGVFKLFDLHSSSIPSVGAGSLNVTVADSELATLDVDALNVKGGVVVVSKSTDTATGDFTSNNNAISVTLTTQSDLNDDTRSSAVTVTTDKASATSVVIGTSSLHLDVHVHSVASGSFKFDYTNRSGSTLSASATPVFNFVIM